VDDLPRATLAAVSDFERGLPGGLANTGRVVRAGRHVLRPAHAHTASVHAFLAALRDVGYDGAPVPVGIDPDGRERLLFIDGDVAIPPYPAWSQSATALTSTARLLRAMHGAARLPRRCRRGLHRRRVRSTGPTSLRGGPTRPSVRADR
jgi:hypothetical protein